MPSNACTQRIKLLNLNPEAKERYLSDSPVWLTLTAQQIELNGKEIAVIDSLGVALEGYLRVLPEDSQGAEGRYSVSICSVGIRPSGDVHTDDGSTPDARPETMRQYEQFLSQELLDLIRRNDSELTRAELVIDLPADAEPLAR